MNHLFGVLADQFCYMSQQPEGIYGATLRDFHSMSGHMYSLILSALKFKRYRLRNYINITTHQPNGNCVLRILGCLSSETNSMDASLNRNERLRTIGHLHTHINPKVKSETNLY